MNRFCCCAGRRRGGEDASKVNNHSSAESDLRSENGESVSSKQNGASELGADARKSGVRGPKPAKGGNQGAVLVELFTSQGCTSCPPADALISRLGRGEGDDVKLENPIPLVILAYHVEYWDYLGWKDPFASSAWTLKQRAYGQALEQDRIYTPEVVVQGRSHCIASNASSIVSLIQSADRFPAPDIQAVFSRPSPLFLQISLSVSLKFKVEGYTLDAMLVIYENGLVTDCNKGENKGKLLTNDYVVRGLHKACSFQDWPAKKTSRGEVTFQLWDGFVKSKCGVAVFLQNPETMEVYGAQQLELPNDI
ncbi:hypothetical protein Mapa_012463 [Marchantia paleacea]|nr:hypothetical protein Mapa_012463 [Marchantia paleacea]